MHEEHPVSRLFSPGFALALLSLFTLPAEAQEESLLTYIPDDVLYCKVWEQTGDAPEAPEFRNFEQSLEDWINALNDIVEWRILNKELSSLRSSAGVPGDVSISDLLGGKRSALAIFGPGDAGKLRLPALLYITEPRDIQQSKAFLQGLLEVIKSSGAPVTRDVTAREGAVIETIKLTPPPPGVASSPGRDPGLYGLMLIQGLGLSFTSRNGLLFICTNSAILDRVLTLPEEETGRLEDLPDFVMLRDHLPDAYDELAYFSWAHVVSGLKELSKLTAFVPEEDRELVESISNQVMLVFGTCRAEASVEFWDGTTRHTVKRTLLSSDRPPLFQGILAHEPVSFPVIRIAPRKTESVWATNMVSLPWIWNTVWSVIESQQPDVGMAIREEIINGVREATGLDIQEDILSWMGDSFGFVKLATDLESIVPINHFALWFETTDQEKANALLPKIVQVIQKQVEFPVTLTIADYEGRKYSWVEIPIPFLPYQPTLAALDGGTLLCTHPRYLREMMDVYDGRVKGLMTAKSYKQVASLLEEESNCIQFVDCALSTDGSSKALEQGAAVAALGAQQDKAAAKAAFVMQRIAKLISIMGICKVKAARSTVAGDFIRSDQLAVFEDLPMRISIPPEMRVEISLLDLDKNLPDIIRQLDQGGQKGWALLLTQRFAEWFPQQADLAARLAEEIKSATQPAAPPAPGPAGPQEVPGAHIHIFGNGTCQDTCPGPAGPQEVPGATGAAQQE